MNALEKFYNKTYVLTKYYRKEKWSELQRNYIATLKKPGVENEIAVERFAVTINNIEDKGAYWYIGYSPALKATGSCAWGYTTIYKHRSWERWFNQTNLVEYDHNKTYEENVALEEADKKYEVKKEMEVA